MDHKPSRPVQTQPPSAHVRILATTDLHMNLSSFDYYADRPDPTIGFTRTASLIREAQRQAQDALVLLFDNGDSLQGTPFGDWAVQNGGPHPMMQAFKSLGYDAIGLGNHDFGFGLEAINHMLSQSSCPVVCSNLRCVSQTPEWQDRIILDRAVCQDGTHRAIRIGVFSVLPPQTARWESHLLHGEVVVDDILTTAQHTVGKLLADGCDVIVALAHSGLGQSRPHPGLENAVVPLAEINGIDAIIAGHTHLAFPNKVKDDCEHVDHTAGRIHNKPVVLPGSAGSHLGVIDLRVEPKPGGGWRVSTHQTDLRPIFPAESSRPIAEDPDMLRLFASGHAGTRTMAAEPVAWFPRSLHSYFSFCAPDRGLALVASAQAAAVRSYLPETAWAHLPLLSAVSPCKTGGRGGPRHYTDVPAGEICQRHVADLHVFPNELRAVLITGAQLHDWLEMSASVFNQLVPGSETDLMDTRRAGYNFDIIFGLTYQIDPSRPACFDAAGNLTDATHGRVQNLTCQGRPFQPDHRFVVALNNYRASGGGQFPFVKKAQRIELPPLDIKSVVRDYLTEQLPHDPINSMPYPFSLTPQSGTHAILKTGPGALRHLSDIEVYDPQVLKHDSEGFAQIRLTL